MCGEPPAGVERTPPRCEPLQALGLWAICLGIKPLSLFLLPVQMPKLCAATGFELLETDENVPFVGGVRGLWM